MKWKLLPWRGWPSRPRFSVLGSEPRRYGSGTMLFACVLSALLGAGGVALTARLVSPPTAGAAPASVKELYQCPMHPTITQDHPGDCPICGMKLVKVQQEGAAAPGSAAPAGERKVAFYRSPMNPAVTSPTPRKDEMGMDYVPVYADEVAGASSSVDGMAVIDIDPGRQQLIGLTTEEVKLGEAGGEIRTVARVAEDETRVRHINVKVAGFVERVHANYLGKSVKRGEPLFSFYSPEIFVAQSEYLLAVRSKAVLAALAGPGGGAGDPTLEAARTRLQLLDVGAGMIKRLEQTGKPARDITFVAPITGVVTRKDAVDGMSLEAGAMPFEIVDLSHVWVLADVYESELRFVQENIPGTLTLNAFPGRTFEGKVIFIAPVLDPLTRTVQVRLAFPNPSGELRPQMFGEVVLQTGAHQGLVVPADAIIDSGTSKIVFVALDKGKFQPRAVQTGRPAGSLVEVTKGLIAGERVVTRANFLLDSESRLRASLQALTGGGKQADSARVLPPTGSEGAGVERDAGRAALATSPPAGHEP